jgi:hypothetical protein
LDGDHHPSIIGVVDQKAKERSPWCHGGGRQARVQRTPAGRHSLSRAVNADACAWSRRGCDAVTPRPARPCDACVSTDHEIKKGLDEGSWLHLWLGVRSLSTAAWLGVRSRTLLLLGSCARQRRLQDYGKWSFYSSSGKGDYEWTMCGAVVLLIHVGSSRSNAFFQACTTLTLLYDTPNIGYN